VNIAPIPIPNTIPPPYVPPSKKLGISGAGGEGGKGKARENREEPIMVD
jgi:hypothetical protein